MSDKNDKLLQKVDFNDLPSEQRFLLLFLVTARSLLDAKLTYSLFARLGIKIDFIKQESKPEPDLRRAAEYKNPYFDPDMVHPRYALLLILAVDGIHKHINLLPYILSPILHLHDISEIRFEDSFYGQVGGTLTRFRFFSKIGTISGQGQFEIDKFSMEYRKSVDVILPESVVDTVIEKLSKVQLIDDGCKSGVFHTGGYPYYSIRLFTPTGYTAFVSDSQFFHRYPWCVITQGKQYRTQSYLPNEAFELIQSYVKSHREKAIEESDVFFNENY